MQEELVAILTAAGIAPNKASNVQVLSAILDLIADSTPLAKVGTPGLVMTEFYELDGQTYHKLLLTAHLKSGQRGEHLRNNLHRATKHSLRQFRYVRFLKTDWQRRLRLPVLPYPKPEKECQK